MNEEAEELVGGNASESVVRVGDTVRKPWLENSATVQKYLKALQGAGSCVGATDKRTCLSGTA